MCPMCSEHNAHFVAASRLPARVFLQHKHQMAKVHGVNDENRLWEFAGVHFKCIPWKFTELVHNWAWITGYGWQMWQSIRIRCILANELSSHFYGIKRKTKTCRNVYSIFASFVEMKHHHHHCLDTIVLIAIQLQNDDTLNINKTCFPITFSSNRIFFPIRRVKRG